MQLYNQKLVINSRTLRSGMTDAEYVLWKRIVRQMHSGMLRWWGWVCVFCGLITGQVLTEIDAVLAVIDGVVCEMSGQREV